MHSQIDGFLVIESDHRRIQLGKDNGRQLTRSRLQRDQLFPDFGKIERLDVGSGNKRTILGRQPLDQCRTVQVHPGLDLIDIRRKLAGQWVKDRRFPSGRCDQFARQPSSDAGNQPMPFQQLLDRHSRLLPGAFPFDGRHIQRNLLPCPLLKQSRDLGRIDHPVPDGHVIQISRKTVRRRSQLQRNRRTEIGNRTDSLDRGATHHPTIEIHDPVSIAVGGHDQVMPLPVNQ